MATIAFTGKILQRTFKSAPGSICPGQMNGITTYIYVDLHHCFSATFRSMHHQ